MASARGCVPVVAAPSSRPGAPRGGSASPPEPALQSLRRAADFDRVLSEGRRRRIGAITVATAPGVPGVTRVGLIAGRKVGNAVMRNRAKRRLRHAVRHAAPQPGFDHVIVASRGVVDAPFEALCGWVREGVGS